VLQVKARVPADAASGDVPVLITVGGVASQAGVNCSCSTVLEIVDVICQPWRSKTLESQLEETDGKRGDFSSFLQCSTVNRPSRRGAVR
jgi:hypothetical protein